MQKRLAVAPVVVALAALLSSCGSGNAQALSSRFANKCASPRPGVDVQGTLDDEKIWLRTWTDELYLWYSEVPVFDPAAYATAVAYFDVLKTPARTPSNKPKDQFHFTIPTAQWQAQSSSGADIAYGGVQWAVVARSPPREVRVGFIDPGAPTQANLARGAQVLTVDGTDVTSGDAAALNAGLLPQSAGETHTFSVLDFGATTARTVTLTSTNVTTTPVQNVKTIGTTGYILFNDHIATSEPKLIDAINQLQQAGVTELVLDIRYNGGGYLAIASELAYMIAGPSTAGKTFEKLSFNDKYPTIDPVTGQPLTPTPFLTKASFIQRSAPLPSLGLSRVFVLTGPGTCSASESIINGLRGVDVQVIQIGSATCGKPYGFYPADNCGTTYFSIQFKGVNAKGFGDYADGFIPNGTGAAGVAGCQVADDFGHALGDPAEARVAAALQYAAGQPCPPPTGAQAPPATALQAGVSGGAVSGKAAWRQNRILSR